MFSTANQSTTFESNVKTHTKQQHIFVLQLHDGKFVIGQGSNPCKRIAAINSGLNMHIKKSLMVNRIVGIKERTDERTLEGVVYKFCAKYGADNVITV